jgi:hypothetical protein
LGLIFLTAEDLTQCQIKSYENLGGFVSLKSSSAAVSPQAGQIHAIMLLIFVP